MAKISEMSDDEASAMLLKAYRGACDCYDSDLHGDHPSLQVNKWFRNARAAASGAPVEGEIQKQGSDNPPDFAGKPANPALAKPAQDGRFERGTDGVDRFTSNGRTVTGDAALLARARASNPSTVRGMTAAIKGYGRLK